MPDLFARQLQHGVPGFSAVSFTEDLEPADIKQQGIHGQRFIMGVIGFHIADKIIRIVQFCQRIPLGGLNDLPGFRQLDALFHAGLHNFRARVGLGNKIDGAKAQALHLSKLITGENDHGQAPVGRI